MPTYIYDVANHDSARTYAAPERGPPVPAIAGPPPYTTWGWAEAARSVRTLADLEPQVLAPGHGRPLTGGAAAALHHLASGRRGRRGPAPR